MEITFDGKQEVFVSEVASANAKQDVEALLSRMKVTVLSSEQHATLKSLMARHYSLLSQDEDDIGLCDLITHRIRTTDDNPSGTPPISASPLGRGARVFESEFGASSD